MFPFGGEHSSARCHLTEARISVLLLTRRVKETEVGVGKRCSAAQRALCGRFPWSALDFGLSKETLKTARHAGEAAYLFNMHAFRESLKSGPLPF